MSEEELTEEEKEKLEQEKAESWLAGQRMAKKRFIPSAYEKYWREIEAEGEQEEKEIEEE